MLDSLDVWREAKHRKLPNGPCWLPMTIILHHGHVSRPSKVALIVALCFLAI